MGKANLCSFIRSCDIFMSMNCLNIFNTVLVKFDFKLTFFEFISHDILLLLFASSLFRLRLARKYDRIKYYVTVCFPGLSFPVFKGIMKKGYRLPTPVQRKVNIDLFLFASIN